MNLYTTPCGYRRLLNKINSALADYDQVVSGNEEAAGAGDSSVWHDNFAYEENQRQMHKLAARVSELKGVRAQLTVIELPKCPTKVGIGTIVIIEDQESGQVNRYLIAGYEDGDPLHERLSYTAPLASVLLGAKVGEMRTFHLKGRTKEFAILAIQEADKGEDL